MHFILSYINVDYWPEYIGKETTALLKICIQIINSKQLPVDGTYHLSESKMAVWPSSVTAEGNHPLIILKETDSSTMQPTHLHEKAQHTIFSVTQVLFKWTAPVFVYYLHRKFSFSLTLNKCFFKLCYSNQQSTSKRNDYLSLPTADARPIITDANADFTWELASVTSSLRHGRMFVITICSRLSAGRFWQKSAIKQASEQHCKWLQ